MKMSALVAGSMCVIRTSVSSFVLPTQTRRSALRLFATSSTFDVQKGVSRMETLQTLLSKHGAPGSQGCTDAGDLEPVFLASPLSKDDDTPELISSIMGIDQYTNLHPHLYPLAKSKKSGNLICAMRRSFGDDNGAYETGSSAPWPIVEAKLGGPGMKLLALNSEHLMRRIVCNVDFAGTAKDSVSLYNSGLGENKIKDAGLDAPYEPGSVETLGYGVDKYVLLRVGPFADIYKSLAIGHAERGDESSALIAAEAASNKISGFASNFLFFASLLESFNRSEEARDAARICLRMPLPSIGLTTDDFREVAILGQLADASDSDAEVMVKLQAMYEKIRAHEKDEDPRSMAAKTPEQQANDEANYLLDTVALTGGKWSEVRPKIADIYRAVGMKEMADFVNPKV